MWRVATPNDHPAVVRFYLALNAEDPGPSAPDPARMERTLGYFARDPQRGCCLVLDEGGSIQGYALLVPYWSNERGGFVCCIDEMYVEPGARGRGRGSGLLTSLARGALGWAVPTVALQLEVSSSNPRARALYERYGFTPSGNITLVRALVPPHHEHLIG